MPLFFGNKKPPNKNSDVPELLDCPRNGFGPSYDKVPHPCFVSPAGTPPQRVPEISPCPSDDLPLACNSASLISNPFS